ncbi:LuxR C-terminal-related transcriptional regulator [Nocardioides jensenii]|uniref:LuxR C-terminal-related transcriptional regulator n=1 Tax=Nocardioides jensenii TaxID=1843 RepID=UPI00083724D8|nr:LuxR C-terminal-related transcriptional regulator [Nocardioides jensenii]
MIPADRSRAVSFALPRRTSNSRRDRELRLRAATLTAALAESLHGQTDTLIAAPGEPCSPQRLSFMARFCAERARLTEPGDEYLARSLYLLALDLHQLVLEIQQEELVSSTRRLEACGDGLARLRNMPTASDMLASACEEVVTRCDFGRVVLSRVERGEWLPSTAHFTESDASWFSEWVGQGIQLRGDTPEARLLTERRPAAVYDTGSTPVHRQIIVESGQSTSYVAAPLMAAGTVVGFLHADHFPSDRQVDEVDRDVLWAFAEGLTRIHERVVLMERVQGQRAKVESVLRTALDGMGSSPGTDLLGAGGRLPVSPEVLADLTTREIEVLHLIVEGASNRGIGSRLVITEDTVKSHVKQILRKLGVSNRAQAIACVAGTTVA